MSYLSETDDISPSEMLSSQPVLGDHHKEEVIPRAVMGAEASAEEYPKSAGMPDKIRQKSGTPSQNILWKGINVYEMINHIICELAIDSREAVINYLVNDIPLDTLREWREELFQAARSTYEATVEETKCTSREDMAGFELRQGAMSAREIAGDVIALVLYTAGPGEHFPKDILCSKSMCTYKELGKPEPKGLMMGDADTQQSRGDDVSPNDTLQDHGINDMITNLAYQINIESTDGVVQYLAEEIPLNTIEKWREDIFQVACNTYEANLAQSNVVAAKVKPELRLRRGSLSVQDYAEDIVKLVPYVSGSRNRFPLDVLGSQRMRGNPELDSLPHNDKETHGLGKNSKDVDVVPATAQSDPGPPQSITEEDTDVYHVITHIVSQLDIEMKQDVMKNLVDKIPWERLKAWREELFQEACRTYQVQRGEMGETSDLTEPTLQLNSGILTAEDYAADVVKLVLHISGVERVFPEQVLCNETSGHEPWLCDWLLSGMSDITLQTTTINKLKRIVNPDS